MSDSLKTIDEVLEEYRNYNPNPVPFEPQLDKWNTKFEENKQLAKAEAKAQLQRIIAAERLDELSAAFVFDGGHNQVVDIDGKVLLHSSSIRFQDYYDDRAKELEQLIAAGEEEG